MFVSSDFIKKCHQLDVLGSGTFGSAYLCQTPVGKFVVKETKISDESIGYPHDFINEVDMMIKLRPIQTVVTIEGIIFDDTRRKGYIVMQALDTNLSKWARHTSFETRISNLYSLISMIGTTLVIMHHHGLLHNDMKANNILVSDSGSNPFFKLADFGKAKCINDPIGKYGCIERYKSPFNLNLYNAEFWAFMVTLVEVITAQRLFEREGETASMFYSFYMRSGRFDLERFLRARLSREQYHRIPEYFWEFITPLISGDQGDLKGSLQRIGIEIDTSLSEKVGESISRSMPPHSDFIVVEAEMKRRLRSLRLVKFYPRFSALFNRFLHLAQIEFTDTQLRQYAEVALTLIIKKDLDRLHYFNDRDTLLLYQRAFFTLMGYQVHVLPGHSLF